MRRRYPITLATAVALVLAWTAGPAHAAGGTTYTWVGSSQNPHADNHSWTDSRNWSPADVPGDGDSVLIEQPDGSHCTAHVDNVPMVSLVNFTLLQDPTLCGTSITSGAITVTGQFAWDGGSIDTPMTLAAGSTGVISGSNGRLNALSENMDVAGSLTMSNAASPAGLRIAAPTTLHVEPTGTLAASGTDDITFTACCVAPAKVINDGTLSVAGGSLHIDAVELDQNHDLDTGAGGQLLTTTAPISVGPNGSYAGTGRWAIEDQAKARVMGAQTLGAGFHLELGGLDVGADAVLGGTASFAGTGTIDWTGGTVEGNFTIGHGVRMNVSGVHVNNGRRQLLGRDYTASAAGDPATLTNHGTITVDKGATIGTGYTARLVNASDGTLNLAPGTALTSGSCCVNPDKILNQGGTLSVPSGSSADPVVITNIAYQATGGSTSIAAGRELHLDGGAPNALATTSVTGGGRLTLTEPTGVSGTVTLGSRTHVLLTAPHGSLDGTATVAGTGALDWTGGSISGAVKIATTGGITISGDAAKYLANIGGGSTPSALNLAARTTFAAGTSAKHNILDLGASSLTLGAATAMAAFTDLRGGTVLNTGTLTAAPGKGGRVDLGGAQGVVNRGDVAVPSGTLYVSSYRQTAGSTALSAGAALAGYNSSFGLTLAGGTLSGAGKVAGPVSNSAGTVAPGGAGTVATLHLGGAYTQGAKGRLLVDLASGKRDVLAIGGAATVKGRLATRNVGNYQPPIGTKAVTLTASSLHWSVSCATSSGSGATGTRAGHWAPTASGTRLTLVWRAGARTTC